MVNKELVKQRFEKNLSTYSENAVVQKHMASELVASLINNKLDAVGLASPTYCKIFEIGCGTGTLTKEILNQLDFEELFANDIVENPLNPEIISDKIKILYGDCEKIQFPQNLDLVISNATFQWLENLPAVLDKIHANLNERGILAFNTFEQWNLYQIKTITGNTLNYYKKAELEELLNANFKILYSNSETIEVEFDSPQDVLKHLKLTGVNGITPTKWTKNDLKKFKDEYSNLFKNDKGKLILTYKPLYFICAKIDMIVDEMEPSRTSRSLRGGCLTTDAAISNES